MAIKYKEVKAIRNRKREVIPESADEDNGQIAETDATRLKALNTIRAALNL